MNVRALIRLAIGIAFGAAGFYLSTLFLNPPEAGVRLGVRVISVALGLGAGIYVFPLVTRWVGYWSGAFAQRVAKEVISQLRIPQMPQMPRISNPVRRGRNRETSKWVNPMVVDTSALIDGRILGVAESHFLFGTIIVPNFILLELQNIADSSNELKRARGRRGFEILEALKKINSIKIVVYETGQSGLKGIDEKLLKLAKGWRAKLITTDFNLNKVASVSGVKTLNVNDLSNFVKTPLIPGEDISVKLVQEGKEKNQGVAYLPDGTMIVVENAGNLIGETVDVVVSRALQTAAGRMIFAKRLEPPVV
ncbi:MAG: PIN domain-containing protein [Candidatus Woykebacteria bacterium]